ncbi:MAG: nitroreductase family protein [Clostridiales bacterium]|nr:nitroreductase family protein [Clostridiales bacterium]
MAQAEHPVLDAIYRRRSIRRYQPRAVEREKIETLLRAAMAAPSACNLQPWAFIVVDEPEGFSRVRACADQGPYDAPVAIVVCGVVANIPWGGDGWMQDCGAAMENMMLAAVELGLGSVWIGGFDRDALRAALDIPEGVAPMAIAYFGYPAEVKRPRTWYTDEAVYWQKFDPSRPRALRTVEMLQDDIREGRLD